jgi:hypothetical protein
MDVSITDFIKYPQPNHKHHNYWNFLCEIMKMMVFTVKNCCRNGKSVYNFGHALVALSCADDFVDF